MSTILPRITVHEYRLAISSSNSTKMAIGPMLLIISASALKPCVAGAGLARAAVSLQEERQCSGKNRHSPHYSRYQTPFPRPSYRSGCLQLTLPRLIPLPLHPAIHAMLRSDSCCVYCIGVLPSD